MSEHEDYASQHRFRLKPAGNDDLQRGLINGRPLEVYLLSQGDTLLICTDATRPDL